MSKLSGLFLWVILYSTSSLAANSPNIIVSIKPFYNICAKVMESVGQPHLLLTQNASPHDYQLKPSDAKLIDNADLIIWGGASLESYLEKSVNTLANKELDLATVKGLMLLPLRTSTNWEAEAHHNGHLHAHEVCHDHHHHHGVNDSHFWLDPDNAIVIANAIAKRLGEIDPKNAKAYQTNAAAFAKQINLDKKTWKEKLAPYKKNAYIVSHDAYQYFNKYFGLDGVGSVTLHPEIPPSIQRVQQIQSLLEAEKVRCIFSEPQFSYKIIQTLVSGTHVHQGELDPLGQDKDIGPNGYFVLMDDLVKNFVQCNKQ